MPAYLFEIRWNKGEKTSWTNLASDDSARDFAQILIRSFTSSSQYRGPAHLAVKNHEGALIALIQF